MCDNAQDIDGTLVAESLRKGRGGYGEREWEKEEKDKGKQREMQWKQ